MVETSLMEEKLKAKKLLYMLKEDQSSQRLFLFAQPFFIHSFHFIFISFIFIYLMQLF